MTASEARCVCCDLPVRSCGRTAERIAEAAARARRRELLTLPGVHQAMWEGLCAECSEPFPAGTPIRSDGQGGWRSLECCPIVGLR